MRSLAIMNQKGGCGKTTVAVNLSAALAESGKKVLLMDIDPQGHAGLGMGIAWEDLHYSSYDLFMRSTIAIDVIRRNVEENLDIVPASPVLAAIEQELRDTEGREIILANRLKEVEQDYDFIVMDCPPSIGMLTFNAILASREILIPIDPSYFSLRGLQDVCQTVESIKEQTRHEVAVAVLLNGMDRRTNFSREVIQELESPELLPALRTIISHSVRVKEAARKGVSVLRHKSRSRIAVEFRELASEVVDMVPEVKVDDVDLWQEKLYGPRRVTEGILFLLDAPEAQAVAVTGEFNGWARDGLPMVVDAADGLWKAVVDIEPGEYEYRFIVDGKWIRDPGNAEVIVNDLGQENSLLVV